MTRLALPAAAPPGSPVSGVPPWPLQGIHPFTAKCRGREGAGEEFAGSEPVVLGGVRDQPGTVSPARSHSPLGSWGLCFLLLTMNPCSPAASGVYSADKANSSVKLRASITEGDARARGKLRGGEWAGSGGRVSVGLSHHLGERGSLRMWPPDVDAPLAGGHQV